MDRWRQMEKQRWEESEKRRAEETRSERKSQKKEDAGARKGRKVAKHWVQWSVAPEGRKVGSLMRQGRSHLAKWEMKSCTPLRREAHLEVKMYKTHHPWTTFGSWDVENVNAVLARSTFPSQNVQNTSCSVHRCGAKHISKSKVLVKTDGLALLEVDDMSKKCTPLWREAYFEVKMLKAPGVRTTFGRSDAVSRGRRKGLCTLSKVSKTWCFCSMSKNDGRRGTFEEDLQRCIFRGRRSTKRHLHQSCSEVRAVISWEGLHIGASDLQVCWNDSAGAALRMTWHHFFVAGAIV